MIINPKLFLTVGVALVIGSLIGVGISLYLLSTQGHNPDFFTALILCWLPMPVGFYLIIKTRM